MKVILTMTLERQAKNKGGDRYCCEHEGEKLVVYFPQSISRENNSIKQTLTVTVES